MPNTDHGSATAQIPAPAAIQLPSPSSRAHAQTTSAAPRRRPATAMCIALNTAGVDATQPLHSANP